MCGIVGAVDLEATRAFDPYALARMSAAVRRRGPDGTSSWSAPGIAMSAERLAIQDALHGRQPLSDPSGRVWASQNGELWGGAGLRRDLEARGHRFRTHCDTELWPALYLEAGEGVFARAKGQFAVALWDERERTLLLGRDRLGICPLHYTVADGWLLWASEIKGLLASGLVEPRADERGIDTLFALFAAGTRRTCFHGVEALSPGHYLRVRGRDVARKRYWDLAFPRVGDGRRGDEAALTREVHALLRTAVERRLVSDGPVATYLSSGLDSTLLLGLATEARGRSSPGAPIQAFTVGYDGAGSDERAGATEAARVLGATLETVVPSGADLLAALPGVVEAAEGPVMDTADASLSLLAERVSRLGYKVVLTGEGADEAMGGYVWHKLGGALRALGRMHPGLPGAVRSTSARLVAPGAGAPTFAARFSGVRAGLVDVWDLLSRGRWFFYSDGLASLARAHDPFDDLDVDVGRMREWEPLDQGLYLEYKVMLPGHLLHGKGDRVAMRSAVETRYPFLDEDFVALASTLAPELKLRATREKWLLREVASRALPPSLANRQKRMFKAHPICSLRPHPRWLGQLTSEESLRKTGYFSPERVGREERLQRWLPASAPRRAATDGSYTAVVTTQLWHHLFLGGGLCELPTWSPPQVG